MHLDLAICKHFNCLPTEDRFKELSIHQKILLYDTIIYEKNDNLDLIKSCFDSLKPWLDKDMYFNMEDSKKNTRINTTYKNNKNSEEFTKPIDYIDEGDGIIIGD